MQSNIGFALLITSLAGLSTIAGSLIGLLTRYPSPRFLTITLGFSAGAMLLVSFTELLQSGIESLGLTTAYVSFFAGILLMFLIDALVPHVYMGERCDLHGAPGKQPDKQTNTDRERLTRAGILLAVGLIIHNFPEGMASFAGAVHDRELGIAIAFAIALHNIPEGLAVSTLMYSATGNRWKAFLWAFLASIAEPLGACLAALTVIPGLNDTVLGTMLSAVAGIMVFISLDELIPVSRSFGEDHLSIIGIIMGMAVMVIGKILL
ncbi:MAG TPA: zinc transporter ZupT [Corynebacteriales bacterium]|nr:zinc transporter ZupT [Mycobacteriales bacterium]